MDPLELERELETNDLQPLLRSTVHDTARVDPRSWASTLVFSWINPVLAQVRAVPESCQFDDKT